MTFDGPIDGGSLDEGQLTVIGLSPAASRFNVANAYSGGTTVAFELLGTVIPTAGPPRANYDPGVSPIMGSNGFPVLAFSDFPVTVV